MFSFTSSVLPHTQEQVVVMMINTNAAVFTKV
jgi:hypothetical protein